MALKIVRGKKKSPKRETPATLEKRVQIVDSAKEPTNRLVTARFMHEAYDRFQYGEVDEEKLRKNPRECEGMFDQIAHLQLDMILKFGSPELRGNTIRAIESLAKCLPSKDEVPHEGRTPHKISQFPLRKLRGRKWRTQW